MELRSFAGLLLAFVLGGLLTFGVTELAWRFPLGSSDEADLTLVIPAVTTGTYRFERRRGFTALLRSGEGRRLELPTQWLPGDATLGDRFDVTTNVAPGNERSAFDVLVEPAQ